MAIPVVPDSIAIYLIAKENQKNGKMRFSKAEVLDYINSVVQKASEYGDEQCLEVLSEGYNEDFYQTINKICDINKDKIEINLDKFNAKGKRWASSVICCMPFPLICTCIKILGSKIKEQENSIGINI